MFGRYKENIQRNLGYDTYVGTAYFNRPRGGGQESRPIITLAKSKEHAENKLKGNRFTWQHNERYVTGSARKGNPSGNVMTLNNYMDDNDSNTKVSRATYTGKSDAQYKAESDRRKNLTAPWKVRQSQLAVSKSEASSNAQTKSKSNNGG